MIRLKLEKLKLGVKGPFTTKGLQGLWAIGEERDLEDSLAGSLLSKYPDFFKKVRYVDEPATAAPAKTSKAADPLDGVSKQAAAKSNKMVSAGANK